MIITKYMIL